MPRRATSRTLALVAAVALAAGACGGSADETDAAVTAPTPTTTPTADEMTPTVTPEPESTPPAPDGAAADDAVVVEVSVAGGSVDTAESRVEVAVGSLVRLVVTSDVADELHVHGVDIEQDLAAGQPAVLEFVPEEPGLYDVETHDSHLLLVQIAAR